MGGGVGDTTDQQTRFCAIVPLKRLYIQYKGQDTGKNTLCLFDQHEDFIFH